MKASQKSNTSNNLNNINKIKKYIITRFSDKNRLILHCVSVFLIILGLVTTCYDFVKNNIMDILYVYVNGQEIGILTSNDVLQDYKNKRKAEFKKNYPYARMILRTDLIDVKARKIFKTKIHNEPTLNSLDRIIKPKSFGVEINVDGKTVAIVKDKKTANKILEVIKKPFNIESKKPPEQLTTLSDEMYYELEDSNQLKKTIGFMQDIELVETPINPEKVEDPEKVLKKLQTGNVEPVKYTVVKGDCISCIAQKYGLTSEYIFVNNPRLKDDKLQIGDEIDLTVLKPTISVKISSQVTKSEEIRYITEYELNDEMKNGVIKEISQGKNGKKNVIYEITKVNGIVIDETVISEEIIENPINAKAYRGTKIIPGMGSGKFLWPVTSPRITSTFGIRWGALHTGLDMTGNTQITSSDNGKVITVGYDSGYGNHIIIDHLNGFKTLYAHLSQILVEKGTNVEKNEQIGIMGNTGNSTGVHLHFEIIENGTPINPLKFLNH